MKAKAIKPFWLNPQARFIESKLISEGFSFIEESDLGFDNMDFLDEESVSIQHGDWTIAFLIDQVPDLDNGGEWTYFNSLAFDDYYDEEELAELDKTEDVFTLLVYYRPTEDFWVKGFIDEGVAAEQAAEDLEKLMNKWLIEERFSPDQLVIPGLENFLTA